MSVLAGILGLLIPIAKWWLESTGASKERKKNFFEWVDRVGGNLSSTRLSQWAKEQMDWLDSHEFEETVTDGSDKK